MIPGLASLRVHCASVYHFVVAAWRAKAAGLGRCNEGRYSKESEGTLKVVNLITAAAIVGVIAMAFSGTMFFFLKQEVADSQSHCRTRRNIYPMLPANDVLRVADSRPAIYRAYVLVDAVKYCEIIADRLSKAGWELGLGLNDPWSI